MDNDPAVRLRADVRSLRRWAIFAAVVFALGVVLGSLSLARRWADEQVAARIAAYDDGREAGKLDEIQAALVDIRASLERQRQADVEAREAMASRLDGRIDDVTRHLDHLRGATLASANDVASKLRVLDSRSDWASMALVALGVVDPRFGDPLIRPGKEAKPASEVEPKEEKNP